MKSTLFVMLMLLSFVSMSADIKKISETEFEFYNDNGEIKTITIKDSLGPVKYIAAVQQAGYTRFLIRTSCGNAYLLHPALSLNSSPEADALFQGAQTTLFAPVPLPEGSASGIELLPPTSTYLNLQPATQTTLVIDVQRSVSGEQFLITPAYDSEFPSRILKGFYNILADAHFHQYGKSDKVFSF